MSGVSSKKKIIVEEIRAILDIAGRLYQRDKQRFRRILTWINTANRRKVPNEIILRALRRLEEKELSGEWRGEWWPYADATLRHLEDEGVGRLLRRGEPSSVSEILAECLRRSRGGNHA